MMNLVRELFTQILSVLEGRLYHDYSSPFDNSLVDIIVIPGQF